MALDSEQRHVATKLIRVGKRKGATKRDIITALTTGLTEASLHNPHYGDGTSVGWRQEISSYGSVRDRTNLVRSASRFYDELRGKGGSIGSRAQAVQRSAFPGRYAEHVGEAKSIYRALAGRTGVPVASGKGGGDKGGGGKQTKTRGASATATSTSSTTDQQALHQARLGLVQSLDLTGEKGVNASSFTGFKQAEAAATTTQTSKATAKVPGGMQPSRKERKDKGAPKGVAGPVKAVNVPHTAGKAAKIGGKVASRIGGLTITSTTGGTHVPGSYHYSGRAVDISGSPAQMRKLFMKLRKFSPTELFYDPAGYYYKNGSRVSGAIGGHSDHVHFAL